MMRKNILWMSAVFTLFGTLMSEAGAREWAVSLYGGRVTSEHWNEAITSDDVQYEDAHLVVLAVDYTLKAYFEEALTLSVEAQIGKYFGDQDHFEFNLPLVVGRWHRFPWQRHVATTFAYGIGPSYATEVPPVEAKIDSDSARWMVYWFAEFTIGPPQSFWSVLFRLHHRSEAFGLVAENGGANTLTAGLRFCF